MAAPASQEQPSGVTLRVRVQPRASRDRIESLEGDLLRVRLCAPPTQGKANKACVRLLAKKLGIAASRVRIVRGERSREKLLFLEGISPADLSRLLE